MSFVAGAALRRRAAQDPGLGAIHARAHARRRSQDRASSILQPACRPQPARCRSASRRSGSITSTFGAGAAWRSPSASCRSSSAPKPLAKSVPSAPTSPPFKVGDRVVAYGALTCGTCKACREGRDNLCENVGGIMGFHVDGFARDLVNMPARLVVPVPAGLSFRDAACAPVAFSTVQHMLFDNAKLEPGETILVQAGGSGIGTAAIKMAKAIGCTVITTVGDDEKAAKGQSDRRRSRHQLPDRAVRNHRAQAHRQERRRCRLRACRPRYLQRLAALPQARRPARHLRIDLRSIDDHQSVPAFSAAISHLRLIRRLACAISARASPRWRPAFCR